MKKNEECQGWGKCTECGIKWSCYVDGKYICWNCNSKIKYDDGMPPQTNVDMDWRGAS